MPDIVAAVVDSAGPPIEAHLETISVGTGGTSGVDVQDEGSPVLAPATTLNFVGDGVAVTDAGSGVAEVAISGTPGPPGAGITPGLATVTGDGTTSITTTSTSLVDMTSMTVTIAAATGDHLMLTFDCTTAVSSAPANIRLCFNVGGTDISVIQINTNTSTAAFARCHSIPHTVQSGEISGGNVTVKMRWLVSTGTGTINNDTSLNRKPVLTVWNFRQ